MRRIFCVGRNYADHVTEMGSPPDEPPIFFTKPADAIVESGASIPYPPESNDVHHEAELVLAIGKEGFEISKDDCWDYIWGYGSGNDLTRRDHQARAKKGGKPWDWSKGFDNSAIVGALHPASVVGHITTGKITATVDGNTTQDSDVKYMIWPIPNIIEALTRSIVIKPGDLIMTGTPAGVGPIERGQTCTIIVQGLSPATVTLT